MATPATDPPAQAPEYISGIVEGWWVCLCGNEPHFDGFTPSDQHGNPIDPGSPAWDQQTNVCRSCGRILNQDTGLVIGRRSSPVNDGQA
ncbi:hypothetical protein WEI85_07805 [Actinomycetes bacterium KLBMP 9797]